jgi:hypothetical protein
LSYLLQSFHLGEVLTVLGHEVEIYVFSIYDTFYIMLFNSNTFKKDNHSSNFNSVYPLCCLIAIETSIDIKLNW